jgi:hypothetical protein
VGRGREGTRAWRDGCDNLTIVQRSIRPTYCAPQQTAGDARWTGSTLPYPKFNFPKFDLDGLVAMQKANVETVMQAQRVLTDAARAMFKLQAGWLSETSRQLQAMTKIDVAKAPDAVVAETRAATDRAFAVARQQLDVGTRAQGEAADLVAKRMAANVDQVKARATAA